MNLCLISNFITLFGLQIKDSLTLCCFTALGYVGGENMYYEVKSVGEGKGIFFKDIFNKHTRQSQRLRIILQVMQTIKQRLHSDKVYDIPNGVIVWMSDSFCKVLIHLGTHNDVFVRLVLHGHPAPGKITLVLT